MSKPNLFLFLAISLLIQGCCLKKITVKPELSAADLKKATAGNANVDFTFEFQDCCPSREQKALAFQMQKKTQELFDKLVLGEITLDAYNRFAKAASDSIQQVILICNGIKKQQDPNQPKTVQYTEADLENAWGEVRRVLGSL